MTSIAIKRAADPAAPEDGARVLVDRYWPRGVRRDESHLTAWLRDIAPSPALIAWFGHKPERWEEFQQRYRRELEMPERAEALNKVRSLVAAGRVTLVFAARDRERNNARVLADYLATLPPAEPTAVSAPRSKPAGQTQRTITLPDVPGLQWASMAFALFAPLGGIVFAYTLFAEGTAVRAIDLVGLGLFSILTVRRAFRLDRAQRSVMAFCPDPAPLWTSLGDFSATIGGFVLAVAALAMLVLLLGVHAR